jgi:hypothetical protein
MTNGRRSCECGAVYRRSESVASARQINSFECAICGAIMESWNTDREAIYRLIIGLYQGRIKARAERTRYFESAFLRFLFEMSGRGA